MHTEGDGVRTICEMWSCDTFHWLVCLMLVMAICCFCFLFHHLFWKRALICQLGRYIHAMMAVVNDRGSAQQLVSSRLQVVPRGRVAFDDEWIRFSSAAHVIWPPGCIGIEPFKFGQCCVWLLACNRLSWFHCSFIYEWMCTHEDNTHRCMCICNSQLKHGSTGSLLFSFLQSANNNSSTNYWLVALLITSDGGDNR